MGAMCQLWPRKSIWLRGPNRLLAKAQLRRRYIGRGENSNSVHFKHTSGAGGVAADGDRPIKGRWRSG